VLAREPDQPEPVGEPLRFARRLDQELSEAERRLFPDSAPAPRTQGEDEEARKEIDEIDLDSFGVETLPGLRSEAMGPELVPAATTNGRLPHAKPPISLLQLKAELEGDSVSESAPVAAPPTEEGSLAETDLAQLLCSLHASGWTGCLRLVRSDGEKQLFLEAGTLVLATSTFAHDQLGDLLYREGKLTREQLAKTREIAPPATHGRKIAALFVEQGLLKPKELFSVLRHQVEEIFYSCFAWDDGVYRLELVPAPMDDRLRLSTAPWALILEGIRRKYGLERLLERVGPPETVLAPTTSMPRALGECGLTLAERRACELCDGERSLAEIQRALAGLPSGELSETGLWALAWALLATGAAHTGGAATDERHDFRAASTLVVSGAAARDRRQEPREEGELVSDRAVDRERLLAKQLQIADSDYFSILGVDRQASSHEIERAFDRLRRDFAPERFGVAVREELAGVLSEIHEVLGEARRILGDEAARRAYRENLVD
jgi:hypothetical protein